jgi:tRNA U34 5-carboxymethylaminomethyl modifying GTPase MnmE/TrmE
MEQTIAAISTSTMSSGGISIVRISGENAISVADTIFEAKKEVVKETEKAVKKETAPKADNSKVSATQAVNASEEDLEEKANNNEP